MKKRSFRSSTLLSFGANIQIVLYECKMLNPIQQRVDDHQREIQTPGHFLKLFVNEKPHLFPGCSEMMCPYFLVREKFREFTDNCDFLKMCKHRQAAEHTEL